eukprot:4079330-Alexandrium_andersonii.AAC.1
MRVRLCSTSMRSSRSLSRGRSWRPKPAHVQPRHQHRAAACRARSARIGGRGCPGATAHRAR